MKGLSLSSLVLTAALANMPVFAAKNDTANTQASIHEELMTICNDPRFSEYIVNPRESICGEPLINNQNMIIGGTGAVVLASVLALLRRRSKQTNQNNDGNFPGGDNDTVFDLTPIDGSIGVSDDTTPPESDDILPGGLEPINIVSEASIYMEYGKFDGAEKMLLAGLQENPDHLAAYRKLLELYYKKKDTKKFQEIYIADEMVHFRLAASEDDMVQIRAWGNEIDPENPIYTDSVFQEMIIESPQEMKEDTTNINPQSPPPIVDKLVSQGEEKGTETPDIYLENSNPSKKIGKMPSMAEALLKQLSKRGFEVIKDSASGSIYIHVTGESSGLIILDANESPVQTIEYMGSYTIDGEFLSAFLDLKLGDRRIKLTRAHGKAVYIKIVGEIPRSTIR